MSVALAHSRRAAVPSFEADAHEEYSATWAAIVLRDFERIWRGYDWSPPGWTGWYLNLGVDHGDLGALTATAEPRFRALLTPNVRLAERVAPEKLSDQISTTLSEFVDGDFLSSSKDGLGRQPSPILPQALLDQLERDLRNPCLRSFNEARWVLADFTKEMGSLAGASIQSSPKVPSEI
jgi:hypothetical protein